MRVESLRRGGAGAVCDCVSTSTTLEEGLGGPKNFWTAKASRNLQNYCPPLCPTPRLADRFILPVINPFRCR